MSALMRASSIRTSEARRLHFWGVIRPSGTPALRKWQEVHRDPGLDFVFARDGRAGADGRLFGVCDPPRPVRL